MFHFAKPARTVHTTWLHCSASDNPKHDDVSVIDAWHKARGWSGVGYHFFIKKDGTVQTGRPINRIGAHVAGHNTGSIGICLHGLEEDRFTKAQFESLRDLCGQINAAYGLQMRFRGHKEVAAKACPVFDYRKVLALDRKGFITEPFSRRDPVRLEAIPETDGAAKADYPELDVGDRGDAVKRLQELLNAAGAFMGVDLKVDGIFGGQTAEAVVELKQEYDLYPSPVVVAHVWRTLIAAEKAQAA
ncbi:peptidoglycan recognition protein family protein [Roseibium sediminicola]|uniref:Peptidoglycan-binding domain-containing protein n=1 Tax=Roseibium sediminicola TaxID=2933272 RepID=A0ABT0H0F2_9HYPH|nr:peptidoglycan-binding domain-containing protein [Roseibium sp. CAU 1639]MCK7615168.1 peptidoglycan-binding domain-containing protein [Roseibium sp. CAU 1639]